MTDHSDFMARYMPPENADRRDNPRPTGHPARKPSVRTPVTAEPSLPPPAAYPDEPPAGARDVDSAGSDVSSEPESVNTEQPPTPRRPAETGAASSQAGVVNTHPAAVSAPAGIGQPPSVQTSAQRWAPRADPRTDTAQFHQHLQVGEVVRPRRQPAEIGWRKMVYVSTRGLVNLGAGRAEATLRGYKALIAGNIPDSYQIAAISVKGGVGKTRMVAGVGSVFADVRKGSPVIAIDANPTYGGLGRLIDPHAVTSIREFLADDQVTGHPKARQYTGLNRQGLEVLAGNQNVANPLALTPQTFHDTVSRTRSFYQLTLIDCGAEIDHEVVPEVLSTSNALMIVGSCNIDGGLAIETTINWLAARDGHELLKRSVIVLNDAYRCADKKLITHVIHTLGPRVRSVKTVPWDAHLRDAATLDFGALRRRTQLALIAVAAELAGDFPTAKTLAR